MPKGIIRLGDKLSSGGSVISATSTMIIEGQVAALVNDLVDCPRKGHGVNKIIQGSSHWMSDGKQVAFDKALCQCGCYVISSMPKVNSGD